MCIGGTRGMGRQMVETFLQEGANVSYSARTVDGNEFAKFHDTLPPSNKARAIGTSLDVSSKGALNEWVKTAAEKFGRLDTVIANGIVVFLCLSHLSSTKSSTY